MPLRAKERLVEGKLGVDGSGLAIVDSNSRSTSASTVPLPLTGVVDETWTTNSSLCPAFAWPHKLAYRGIEHIYIITESACAITTGWK